MAGRYSGAASGGRCPGAGAELPLHQGGVAPAPELEAHRPEAPDMLEPEARVERDGGRRIVADDRNHLPEAPAGTILEQTLEQKAADAAAVTIGPDVDRVLDRMAVGWPRPISARIGIADDLAALERREIRVAALDDRPPAPQHLGETRRFELEARRAGLDVVGIDRGDHGEIRFFGRAQDKPGRHGTAGPDVVHRRLGASAAAQQENRLLAEQVPDPPGHGELHRVAAGVEGGGALDLGADLPAQPDEVPDGAEMNVRRLVP